MNESKPFSIKSSKKFSASEIKLTEEQSACLELEIKKQLREGEPLEKDSKNINLLIAGLGDHRGLVRRTFTEGLGQIGKPAVPALKNALLNHSNVTTRRAAAKALKLIGEPEALPDLLKALKKDPDPVVQGSSAAAIAIFGEKAIAPLLEILGSPKSTAMQCGLASWGLSFVGASASQALLKAAKSNKPLIRAAAIAALGDQIQSLEDTKAKELVVNALNDQNSGVRIEATALLGKLQKPSWARPLLTEKLSDDSPEVRKNAALGLMKLKTCAAVVDLKERELIEKNNQVINVIKIVIKKLENQNY